MGGSDCGNSDATVEIHLGNRLLNSRESRSGPAVLWPLNVAPFVCLDRRAALLPSERARNLARLAVLVRAIRDADAIAFSSFSTLRRARTLRILAGKPTFVVRLVNLHEAHPQTGDSAKKVSLISHRYQYKQVPAAVRSLVSSSAFNSWTFDVIGGGPVRSVERDLSSAIAGDRRCIQRGTLPPEQTRDAISSSTFLALPTLLENAAAFPIQEAFSAGVPVAVSRTDENVEFLGENYPYVNFDLGLPGVSISSFSSHAFRAEARELQLGRRTKLEEQMEADLQRLREWIGVQA